MAYVDGGLMPEQKRRLGRPPKFLTSAVMGDRRSVDQWAADLGIPSRKIHNRLHDGWTDDEALGLVPRDPKSHYLTDDEIRRLERRREQWRRATAKHRAVKKTDSLTATS